MGLNQLQQAAYEMVIASPVSILMGGPGTGKTWTVKEILKGFKKQNLTVAMAAPTGKAAKQMNLATGEESATTIHKLLKPTPRTNPATGEVIFGFDHNKENPINTDVLILDECSMITNSLMADVLAALDYKTKLVLVGDKGQLPSVGCGAVFRDMIESGIIPITELMEIQRNSGDIVKACQAISQGRFYTPSLKINLPEANLQHIENNNIQSIQGIIQQLVCNQIPKQFKIDPIWDIQVISPVNKRTELSCEGLNKVLQSALNPNPPFEKSIFRKGDKIIQTKNEMIKTPKGGEVYVVNGDIGSVYDIDRNNLILKFNHADPEKIRYALVSATSNHLLLAYCITAHRFQGSQAPVIIVPVHSTFSFFLDRSWIYTTISRAEKICITVGEFQAIRVAIIKDNSQKRVTKLKELLINETA